ncbi:MAG: DUF2975 domain-containing protein [Bacteroidota bacterium]|nr:DUF2975 domain-containing protein [Bacteroidota bacterium]
MENQKTPFSINIIYWTAQIVFWLFVLICTATVLFNVLLYTDFFGNDLQLHVHFPSKVNFLETGILEINNTEVKVELVNGTSQIHFFNTPLFIARYFGLAMLVAVGTMFYMMFVFRKFITNVKHNKIFEIANIRLLQNLAYAIFALWIFTIIYMRIMFYSIASNVEFEHIEILEEFPNFAGIPMLALFIWVLSHVFITGVKLQEEQNLTV